jgi:hypothetical protein
LIIVSILSDQPVPNLRLIKHFGGAGVRHIFLTTTKVEKAGIDENLRLAAGIDKSSLMKRVIDPADPALIAAQLASFQFDRSATYLVNVTGGTKMMSQSVTAHFMEGYPDCRIVYLDINTGQLAEIYPHPGLSKLDNRSALQLADYFIVHGYEYKFNNQPIKSIDHTCGLMQEIILNGGPRHTILLQDTHKQYTNQLERTYYSGVWFEEWVCWQIRRSFQLNHDQILSGIKLYSRSSFKTASDHEIDIAFVKNDKLYVIECKVFMKYDSGKFNDAAFKLASISRNLGNACNPILVICVDIPGISFNHVSILKKLSRISGIISWKEIKSGQFIPSLNKILNYVA